MGQIHLRLLPAEGESESDGNISSAGVGVQPAEPELGTHGAAVASAQKRWSDLFKCISEVSTEMKAMRGPNTATTGTKAQLPMNSETDDITRSVIIYGLSEKKGVSDALLVDEVIKGLDATISVNSHRRLKKKTTGETSATQSKSAPILVILTTNFDRVKLLSLSSRLKNSSKFSSVFIKKALTRTELDDVNIMRQACTEANCRLKIQDPELETKYSVIDCKIRRLVRSADTYKVDWSKTFSISDISKN